MNRKTWNAVASELKLSPQQRRIVELILHGMEDAEISVQLGVAVPTIRTHLQRVFARTATENRLTLTLKNLWYRTTNEVVVNDDITTDVVSSNEL